MLSCSPNWLKRNQEPYSQIQKLKAPKAFKKTIDTPLKLKFSPQDTDQKKKKPAIVIPKNII